MVTKASRIAQSDTRRGAGGRFPVPTTLVGKEWGVPDPGSDGGARVGDDSIAGGSGGDGHLPAVLVDRSIAAGPDVHVEDLSGQEHGAGRVRDVHDPSDASFDR